jgi:putative ABC transport system permease protein
MKPFVPLATRTLTFEWRRFLPCCAAMGCAAVLITVQLALVNGIFGSAAVYIDASRGDLWVGLRGTQSIELGRPIPVDTDLPLRADRDVTRVEPFRWVSGNWWAQNGRGEESVFISGIDPGTAGLVFARALDPTLRARLREPGSVIADRDDLDKLGTQVRGYGVINGRRVHLIAGVPGLRALGGVSLVASLDTARSLDTDNPTERPTYYVASVRDGADLSAVRKRIARTEARRVQLWTRDEFANRVVRYWLMETGAGLGVTFISLVVTLAGAVIATQALRAALAPCLKEYATLRAFGIGAAALRRFVVEQALWLAASALLAAAGISYGLIAVARSVGVPAALSWDSGLISLAFVSLVILAATVGAARWVTRLDPFVLLR